MNALLNKSSLKIGIVGAGIMGRLLAWQLANSGHQISLFDKDPIESGNAAAYTAAGMLTPYSEIESAELMIYHLGKRSLKLWPEIIKNLNPGAQDNKGGSVGFVQNGSLIVSHAQDKIDLQRFNLQLEYKLDSLLIDEDQTPPLKVNQAQLAEIEPELSERFSEATFLPDEASLCPKCVMQTLADGLLEKRVRWYSSSKVEMLGPKFIVDRKITHEFDWVIDCRGLGAKNDMPALRGVRGEVILVQAPEVKINRLIRLMHPRYRLYVVPKYKDDLYIIGATQIESDDNGPITVRSALELLTAAYSLHPGFAEARILESKTNCRPALQDNLPTIQTQNGLIRINGLFRHGFLLAPTLAEQVSRFIENQDKAEMLESIKNDYPDLFISMDKNEWPKWH